MIQELLTGDAVQESSTGKLGFFGTTPVTQPANTSSAYAALVSLGLIPTGGTDPSQTSATNPIKHVTVNIASADILALYSAPKLLIAAPGAGHMIIINRLIFAMHGTATAYVTGGGAAIVQWGSTVHGGGTQACDSTIAATVITNASSSAVEYTVRNGVFPISAGAATTYDNAGIYLSAATGDFTVGTGTAVVDIWYYQN